MDLATLREHYEVQLASDGRRVCIGLLTGGKSTRMGQDKATTLLAGQAMAQRVADACAATGLATTVLGPDAAGTGLDTLPDDDDVPPGPLGGLITLLRARRVEHVILIATDQPFVRPETMLQLALAPAGDIVVPIADGFPQVTCARYGPAVLNYPHASRLRSLLDPEETDGIDVDEVAPDRWQRWGEDGRSFRSLDRPEDLKAALADYHL